MDTDMIKNGNKVWVFEKLVYHSYFIVQLCSKSYNQTLKHKNMLRLGWKVFREEFSFYDGVVLAGFIHK